MTDKKSLESDRNFQWTKTNLFSEHEGQRAVMWAGKKPACHYYFIILIIILIIIIIAMWAG